MSPEPNSSTGANPITDHLDLWSSATQQKATVGRGNNGKTSPHGINKLRELILELAVRGKLVPQDPNDEPASVLLEKIAQEKARLVKEKKIKKAKPLAAVSEAEMTFLLPSGWEWVKLGQLMEMFNGRAFKKSEWGNEGLPIVRIQNLNDQSAPFNYFGGEVAEQHLVNDGTFLISWSGTPGTSFGAFVWNRGAGALNQHINKCLVFGDQDNLDYLRLAVNSCMEHLISKAQGGVGLKHVTKGTLNNVVFGFPPLAEQHRIVAKVDELMALCDQLEQQQTDSLHAHQTLVRVFLDRLIDQANTRQPFHAELIDAFDTLFTTEESIDQLKQTILQLAVMGKLVPQNPNDEPASLLLERIAEEKARLIKDKKIKKQKPLPAISDEEKPFELPEGWEWCRLEDVVDIHSGITKGRKLAGREMVTVPYLSVANVQRSFLDLRVVKTIDIPSEEKDKYEVLKGDLLITEGGDWDKVGRTAIWRGEMNYVAHQNHVFKARIFLQNQNEVWLEKYLNSPFSRDYFAGSSKQTTNLASINKTQLRGCLIAVPPAGEKDRIVTKVDELMTLCDTVKARLNEAQTTQAQLADAVVEQAVG